MMVNEYITKQVPMLDSMPPVQVLDGGNLKQLSFNPFDGGTWLAQGDSHSKGGMKVDSTGNGMPDAEVEGGEPIHQSPVTGDKYVAGNLTIPGTNKKFKAVFKAIGKEEEKASAMADKGTKTMAGANPENKYGVLSHNAGNVMLWSATRRHQALAKEKEELSQVQQAIHSVANEMGVKPKELNKQMKFGGKIEPAEYTIKEVPSFDDGGKLEADKAMVAEVARQYGIDVDVAKRLIFQESGFNPRAKSGKGARGLTQLMPATATSLGITRQQLRSDDPKDKRAVVEAGMKYFKTQLKDYNNDYQLALAAYNAGPGTVNDFIKGSGKKRSEYTGQDLMARMKWKRENQPSSDKSLAQNQTYEYINNIFGTHHDDFYGVNGKPALGKQYRDTYYDSSEEISEDLQPLQSRVAANLPIQSAVPQLRMMAPEQQAELSAAKAQASYHPPIKTPSLADSNKLGIGQFLPEIAALGDRPDFVPHQRFTPELFQPYSVSFQDRLNANTSSFRGMQQSLTNNPEALSVLAGQKYNADNQVLAEQFRTNQGIENQVTNQNIQLINQAREKNLALDDQQYIRQAQAKENTRGNQRAAANSIITKIGQNRLENNNIRMQENMFNYRFNPITGKMEYVGPDAVFNPGGISNYQVNPQLNPTAKNTYDYKDGQPVLDRTTVDNSKRASRRYWGGKMKNANQLR